jgi:hypothetical protein
MWVGTSHVERFLAVHVLAVQVRWRRRNTEVGIRLIARGPLLARCGRREEHGEAEAGEKSFGHVIEVVLEYQ